MIPTTHQDNTLHAFFKKVAVKDEHASKAAGRPIYRDDEYCEIRIPGDRYYQPTFPAHAMWKRIEGEEVTYAMRFANQYNRFKESEEQIAEGTPLSELTFLTEAKRQELRGLKIYTAESLAALEGSHLKTLGAHGNEMKAKAKAYLEAARDAGRTAELAAEVEALKAQLQLVKSGGASEDDDAELEALKEEYKQLTGSRPRGKVDADYVRRLIQEVKEG